MTSPRQWQSTNSRPNRSNAAPATTPLATSQISVAPADGSYAFMTTAGSAMSDTRPQRSGAPQDYFYSHPSHAQYTSLQMPTDFGSTQTQPSQYSHSSYVPVSAAPVSAYPGSPPVSSTSGPLLYPHDQENSYPYPGWLSTAPIPVQPTPRHIDTTATYQQVEIAPSSAPAALSSFSSNPETSQISFTNMERDASASFEDGFNHGREMSPVPEGSYRCECGAVLSTTNKSRNQATHRRSKKHRKAMGEAKHKAENLLCRWCSRSYARSDSRQRHEHTCHKRPGSQGKRRKPYCRRSRSPSPVPQEGSSRYAVPASSQARIGSMSATYPPPNDSRSPSSGYPITPMTAPLPTLALDSVDSPPDGPFHHLSSSRRTSFPSSPRTEALSQQHQYNISSLAQHGMSSSHSGIHTFVSDPSSTGKLFSDFREDELKSPGFSQENGRFRHQQTHPYGYASPSPQSASHDHSPASSVAPSFNASPAPLYGARQAQRDVSDYRPTVAPPGSGPPYGTTLVALPSSPLATGSGRSRAWSIGGHIMEQNAAGPSADGGRLAGIGMRGHPTFPMQHQYVRQTGHLFEGSDPQTRASPSAQSDFPLDPPPLEPDEAPVPVFPSPFDLDYFNCLNSFQDLTGSLPPLHEVQLRSDFKQEDNE